MYKSGYLYKKIIVALSRIPKKGTIKERVWIQKYLGSNKPTKSLKGSEIVKFAKEISRQNSLDISEFTDLIDTLYENAKTFEEIDLAARLIQVNPKLKSQIDPKKLDYWLNFVHGWAETDVLCQSNFTDKEILENWQAWTKLLIKLNLDKNVHKRRASLVLLTKPLRNSSDKRVLDLALKNIDNLKGERDILITKVVSWVLRSGVKNHKKEILEYLKKNKDTLPKIAVREVTNKLITGKKTILR